MHREDTATLTNYLSDNLMMFTCLTPLDDHPLYSTEFGIPLHQYRIIFQVINRIERTISTINETLHNNLVTPCFIAQQQNVIYFATINLSTEKLDRFRALSPVIENFINFQMYVKNKQRAREHRNQAKYGYEQSKPGAYAVPQKAADSTLEAMGGQKSSSI